MELNRRDFIKGGIAVGGLAAMAGLAGCGSGQASASASTGTGVPEQWDDEADIIAIGAGGAGLAAGIEAQTQGVSIIICVICESQAMVGGNSAICNGGIAIPGSPLQAELGIDDSPDQMFEDLCAWFATDYDEGYVRMLCDLNGGDMYDWLTSMGVVFEASGLLQSNGHSRPREHHVTPGELINTLNQNAQAAGADIRLNTLVTRIIQNPETKRILGVEIEQNGSTQYLKAKKAVLLCSGGYGRNKTMLNEWNFGPAVEDMTVFNGSLGQLGQGITMAMALGADPRHLSYCGMLTVQNPDGQTGDACAMYHQGAVLVNLEGERFVNEAQGYTNVWSELLLQPENICWQVWDEPIAEACSENESGYYSMSKIIETGLMVQADTLEDLAAQMDIPADAFVATMNQYNADIEGSGVDSAFGRAHLSGTGAAPVALTTPPYYAFKTTSVVSSTYGGLKRWQEDHLQAVDVFGNVIPGLYLAGNISDFCNMGIVPGTRRPINASGCSFGGSMSFGRKCVQEMAKLDNWDEA